MLLASYIIGTHLWFFRDGDAFAVPEAGVCGVESKPGIAPDFDAGWIDLGAVESFEPTVSQEDYKLWKPAPGRLVLKDLLENKQEMTLKFTTNDVGPLVIETMFRSSQKLGGAQVQFNPISAIARRGWLHCEFYDQDNASWMDLDLFVRLRSASKFLSEPVKPEWEAFLLYSSLNTGVIS